MPTTLISPPYDELRSLSQPLTDGEWIFLEWLKKNLTSDWEIYVQPYMNGLRPDFVLLSPKKGIAVYEVKDWNLSAIRYRYEGDPPKLIGGEGGKRFKIGIERDPVAKIRTYKSEVFELYCPSLGRNHGFNAIVGGIVFPYSPTDSIKTLLHPAFEHQGLLAYPKHNVVIGCDLLGSEPSEAELKRVLPTVYSINKEMTEDVAKDLRHWLVEPEPSKDQRRNAFDELDKTQREIVSTRTKKEGRRRIRGPAGSGKTLVLCGRAARLVGEGKRVLLITFNITLLNYLRDTIARFFVGADTSRRWGAKQYEIMNFHHFCSRLADVTDNQDAYRQIWRNAFGTTAADPDERHSAVLENVLTKTLPAHAMQWVGELSENDKYDAIFVDEGQDLRPEWWEILMLCLKDNGEALLAADRTQNVYSVDQAWASAPTSGFRGPWKELTASYRLPSEVTLEAQRFIDQFLPEAHSIRPESPKSEDGLFSNDQYEKMSCLRWINTAPSKEEKIKACLSAMDLMIKESELSKSPLNYADLTFLVESDEVGIDLRKAIVNLGIRVIDTFDTDTRQARRKKMAFRNGDGRVKITTVFSYKGWETRSLIIQVGQARTERDHALFYTALTRLKISQHGSYLTVVNSSPEYRPWGSEWAQD